jgi:cathepsin B
MMKAIILAVLLTFACSAERILKQETYQKVKQSADWNSYDWDENPFKDYTHDQLHFLMGTNLRWNEHNIMLLADEDDHSIDDKLPKEFDSRKQWPDCILPVRDQQHCGSCWAFSGTSVLQDRLCIASKGSIKTVLSPQYMVSCDGNDHGCQGGMLDSAWEYFEKTGVVADECFPYVSGDGKNVPQCPADNKCPLFKAKVGSSKALTCSTSIKQEIMTNGPVQTGFFVYEDFMHYKGGIYDHNHGHKLGGHAVVIVGWGEEDGKEYWIAQNSWGPNWGENGFFRIKVGQCLFEENAYVGLADVDGITKFALSKLFLN